MMNQGTFDGRDDFFDRDIDDFGDDGAKEDAPLSWRLNGCDSLSDWTIVVTRNANGDGEDGDKASSETYHVHKNILAVGPRKSEYFVALFQNQHALAESSTSTTNVDLEGTAAEAFPAMLDYMYEGKEEITTENAIAVRHLARYFRIRRLFEVATGFIRREMDFYSAGGFYLPEAYKYHDEKMIEAAIRVCARDIEEAGAEVLGDYTSDLFKRIITSEHLNCSSDYLSVVVAEFYSKDRESKDEELVELFDVVTDEKIMPRVDAHFAAFLLLKWDMLCQKFNQERSCSLRDRCIDAISNEWQNTLGIPLDAEANGNDETTICSKDGTSYRRVAIEHRKLDPSVQIELLEKALRKAQIDMEQKDEALRKAQKDMEQKDREIKRLQRQARHRDW